MREAFVFSEMAEPWLSTGSHEGTLGFEFWGLGLKGFRA